MQYVPEDGVYVYFRYNDAETIMCIMNTNDKEMDLNGQRFLGNTARFSKGTEVVTGNIVDIKQNMKIPAKTLLVLALK